MSIEDTKSTPYLKHALKSGSIHTKLTVVVFLVLAIFTSLGLSIIVYRDLTRLENELILDSESFGKLLSHDFIKIVSLGDNEVAIDITSKLQTLPNIMAVTLYNSEKNVLYFYNPADSKAIENTSNNWDALPVYTEKSLISIMPLIYQDTFYGYYLIQVSTERLALAQKTYLQEALVYGFGLLLAALLLSALIRAFFTQPILQLVTALNKITETHDFSGRLPDHRNDEIGILFSGFNTMQAEIQAANKALNDQNLALDEHAIVEITDTDGKIRYANQNFVDISGYQLNELLGQDHRSFKSGAHTDDFYDSMFQTVLDNRVWNGDICNKAKNGRLYWVNTTIVPIKTDNKITSFIIIRTDISKLKDAEKRYKDSEERLDLAMSVANDGIWDWNMSDNSVFFDERYFTMAGYKPNEFSGSFENFQSHLHPEDVQMVQSAIEQYLAGDNDKFDVEFRFLHKLGHYIWVRGRGKAVAFDAQDNPIRFVGTHADITEAKNLEISFRRSQKMEAIGKLTGGIAHEFNNILSIILGNLELLGLKLQLDDDSKKQFDAIKISSKRAAELTKQLLNFSHNQPVQLVIADVNDEIKSIDNMINRSVTHQVNIHQYLSESLWRTKFDTGDLHGALLNLVLNANHSMDGRGNLTIETKNIRVDSTFCDKHPDAQEGDYIQITIGDDGEGISLELQEHIFEPFFTTKPQGKGTGLGLAMVFGFVQRSNGYIFVDSEINKGTTFKILLPRTELPEIENKQAKSEPIETTGHNETILVVEDEVHLLEFAIIALESKDYHVIGVPCADDALRLLKKGTANIDMVFSDVVMPGKIDGLELAQIIRTEYPELKILLTSGYTEHGDNKTDPGAIHQEILNKPYSLEELATGIQKTLEN